MASPAVKGSLLTYAAELECSEPDTRHWIHRWCIEKNGGQLALMPPILEGTGLAPTIPNVMRKAAEAHNARQCMGVRTIEECLVEGKKQFWRKGPFKWRTYADVYSDITSAAKGLYALPGISDKRKQKKQVVAALLAETSQEWMISAQAAFGCGITITTVYATLGHEAMLHGIQQTEAEIIFMDWGLFETLKDKVLAKCPALRHVVFIGKDLVPLKTTGGPGLPPFPSGSDLPAVGKLSCTTLDALIAKGNAPDATPSDSLSAVEPGPEDIAIIMYTSGSTGMPKGVVLTHVNFVSFIAGSCAQGCILPQPTDVLIGYLPLAHIFELLVETVTLTQGGSIGYGHPRSLAPTSPYIKTEKGEALPGFEADLICLRPTIMAAVPAILDGIAAGIKKKIADTGGVVAMLFNGALANRMGETPGNPLEYLGFLPILGDIVLKAPGKKFGMDKVRILVSGGAPLAADTQKFVQAIFCPIAQGYGATETTAGATVQECQSHGGRPADQGGGRVGAPIPACEIQLKSVADMGYLVTDTPAPRGEVLISGSNVSQNGYYKLPKETAEAFIKHADGKIWFHTGDIGVMDGDGVLRIVDRKKDLIKLSGGEYVSLGKVEANLKQVPGIGACCVFAQSNQKNCVVIVSQPEKGWASVGGKPEEAELTKQIFAKMKEVGLQTFEIPTKVKVTDDIWTPETGLVTASLKVQRNPLRNHYNGPGGLLEAMDYSFP